MTRSASMATVAAVGPRPAIALSDLSRRYEVAGDPRGLLALDHVTLEVGEGEFVAIVGPSGCGKSTLLMAVAGLLDASDGHAEVLGGSPRDARANRAIGLVTQEAGLLPWRSVRQNVALTFQITGQRADAGEVDALLGRVGMGAFATYHPRELSGGMRQRVALARALAHGPRLLLMDEPFGALDELSREELRLELLRIWERDRVSVLFVTHSIREAVLLADRVIVMSPSPGRVVADMPVEIGRPRDAAVEETPAFTRHVAAVRAALRGSR